MKRLPAFLFIWLVLGSLGWGWVSADVQYSPYDVGRVTIDLSGVIDNLNLSAGSVDIYYYPLTRLTPIQFTFMGSLWHGVVYDPDPYGNVHYVTVYDDYLGVKTTKKLTGVPVVYRPLLITVAWDSGNLDIDLAHLEQGTAEFTPTSPGAPSSVIVEGNIVITEIVVTDADFNEYHFKPANGWSTNGMSLSFSGDVELKSDGAYIYASNLPDYMVTARPIDEVLAEAPDGTAIDKNFTIGIESTGWKSFLNLLWDILTSLGDIFGMALNMLKNAVTIISELLPLIGVLIPLGFIVVVSTGDVGKIIGIASTVVNFTVKLISQIVQAVRSFWPL